MMNQVAENQSQRDSQYRIFQPVDFSHNRNSQQQKQRHAPEHVVHLQNKQRIGRVELCDGVFGHIPQKKRDPLNEDRGRTSPKDEATVSGEKVSHGESEFVACYFPNRSPASRA